MQVSIVLVFFFRRDAFLSPCFEFYDHTLNFRGKRMYVPGIYTRIYIYVCDNTVVLNARVNNPQGL